MQNKKQFKNELKEDIANTFKNIALEWYEKKWKGKQGRETQIILSRLKRHIFSDLGSVPMKKITA